MQYYLHLFMQIFTDCVFLTLYHYKESKESKIILNGLKRENVLVSKKHAASHSLTHSIPTLH